MMYPSSANERPSRKVQPWHASLSGIVVGLQENLPLSTEEVKQKVRSWNKSLGRYCSQALKKRDARSEHDDGHTRTTATQSVLLSLDLHILDPVKKLGRSASNVSSRRKSARSDSINRRIVPDRPARHSAPPAGRLNSIQRLYSFPEMMHPDQYLDSDSRGPLLSSIAESSEHQQLRDDVSRGDEIFAIHEARACQPQAPPTPVERLSFNFSETYLQQRGASLGFERPSLGFRRISSQQDHRWTLSDNQLEEQAAGLKDMSDLRTFINDTRAKENAEPLKFHQNLCAEAKIVATTYENSPGEQSWTTKIQSQAGSSTLELIGPPRVGAGPTAKLWNDGKYSPGTQRKHASLPADVHGTCECRNFTVWEAITDVRWRALGVSKTKDGRMVAVLSQ